MLQLALVEEVHPGRAVEVLVTESLADPREIRFRVEIHPISCQAFEQATYISFESNPVRLRDRDPVPNEVRELIVGCVFEPWRKALAQMDSHPALEVRSGVSAERLQLVS